MEIPIARAQRSKGQNCTGLKQQQAKSQTNTLVMNSLRKSTTSWHWSDQYTPTGQTCDTWEVRDELRSWVDSSLSNIQSLDSLHGFK
jgi:hypothetical protein